MLASSHRAKPDRDAHYGNVAAAETFAPGSTHIWEFVNEINSTGMAMAHPIHVHGTQFRVLSRTGGAANTLREGISARTWA